MNRKEAREKTWRNLAGTMSETTCTSLSDLYESVQFTHQLQVKLEETA